MGFFVSSWAGRIILLVGGVIVLGVAFSGTIFGLAITGGPGDCRPGGGPIVVSDALSDAFQQKWDEFDATLDAGSPASVTFNESEITSRAVTWIEEEEGPDFEDVRVCVHDGYGEATGKLDGPGFVNVRFKLTGTVTLTGSHPVAEITDVDIGNIPDPLLAPFENLADEDALEQIDLDGHSYTVILTEGTVTIEGRP